MFRPIKVLFKSSSIVEMWNSNKYRLTSIEYSCRDLKSVPSSTKYDNYARQNRLRCDAGFKDARSPKNKEWPAMGDALD